MNEKELWEKFYEKPLEKVPWQKVQFDWFKEFIDNNEIKGKTALDLGCGTGVKSIYLVEHSDFEKIIGIDISEKAIEIAKQNAKNIGKCEFFVHDVCDLSFLGDQKFDFILDWANLHGIPEEKREQYIEQINKHSKIGTTFLLRVFNKKDWDTDFFTVPFGLKISLFSKEDLIKLFPNFEILKENESDTTIRSLGKHIFFIELFMKKVK